MQKYRKRKIKRRKVKDSEKCVKLVRIHGILYIVDEFYDRKMPYNKFLEYSGLEKDNSESKNQDKN